MSRTTLTALALALSLGACSNDPAPQSEATSIVIDEDDDDLALSDDGEEESDEAFNVEPPAAVEQAFHTEHPGAADVAWTMKDAGFEASFTEGSSALSVAYRADGTAGAIQTEIAVAGLPAAVSAALARDYAGQTVTEAARIVDGGQATYEAEITNNGVPTYLIYSSDGRLIETTTQESE